MLDCLADPDLALVVICPSNPFVSVDPILKIPGFADALRNSVAPVVAVSPIVAGQALKGPAAKMLAELGLPVSAGAVAAHYRGVVDAFVLDEADATLAPSVREQGLDAVVAPTIMTSLEDREALARVVLALAR